MLTKLPEELLNTVQQYCNRKDWKRFMDTSKEFFRDLKYRTIHVKVSFGKLEDRVLPPIVGKLSNPLQQLHLYLDTEDSLQEDAAEAKSSWSSWGTWRSRNLVTHKDIKWFLSIPAQSLDWYCAGPLLDDDVYMRALRKYEDIKLDLHPHINVFVPYDNLNNSKRIKYLDVSNGWGSKFPKLPSLVELTLSMDTGTEVDLRNLVYSLLLKKVTLEFCENTILLPKQLKDRGVIINCSNSSNLKFVEVEAEQSNNDDIHESNNDENDHQIEVRLSNIYNEDELTVYKHEDDEDGEYENYEDEDDEQEDEDDDNDNDGDHHEDEGDQYNLRKGIEIVKVHEEVKNDNLDENEDEESSNSDFDYSRGKRKYQG